MGESYRCMKEYGELGVDKNSTRYTNELLEKISNSLTDIILGNAPLETVEKAVHDSMEEIDRIKRR